MSNNSNKNDLYDNLIKETEQMYSEGKYDSALEKLINSLNIFLNKKDDLYAKIGTIQAAKNNDIEAIKFLKKSLELNKNNSKASFNLALLYKKNNQFDPCIKILINLLKKKIFSEEACEQLSNIFYIKNKINIGMYFCEKGLDINKENQNLNIMKFLILNALGKYSESEICFNKSFNSSNDLYPNFLWMNTFPSIYNNADEIKKVRLKFIYQLKKIKKIIKNKKNNFSNEDLLKSILSSTNFHLAYQGRNDKILNQIYSQLISNISKKIFNIKSECVQNNKIRLGFITSNAHQHTIMNLFSGWIYEIKNEKIEKYFYSCTNFNDEISEKIKSKVSQFRQSTNIKELIKLLENDNLDFLFFLDVGMSEIVQVILSLKLAKKYLITWGHPVTTGSKNADFFISNELMENKNSENFYSEKLIKLNNIGLSYTSNIKKNYQKRDISDLVTFSCIQSLFKIHYENDELFLKILKNCTNSIINFISHKNSNLAKKIFSRFKSSKLFNENLSKRICFKKSAPRHGFLNYINQSDIILDTLHWSGGNTSLETLLLEKPLVTMQHKYMRGNHTCAFLKYIELDELIAKSKEDYVNIASKLYLDKEYYKNIVKKIKKNKTKIFKYKSSKEIEKFILSFDGGR